MRRSWPVFLIAPALLLGCAASQEASLVDNTAAPPRLTVDMLREAERQRQNGEPDEILQALAPTRGDMFGFGGGLLGDVAAGLPGGAALGFSGHMAGGSKAGKAVGSTFGALVGALLGPVGGFFGGVAGALAGEEMHDAVTASGRWSDPGPIYIDGIDTGPLAALPPAEAAPDKT